MNKFFLIALFAILSSSAHGAGRILNNVDEIVTNGVPLKLPQTQGAAASCFTNDGSGNISWATCGGGGSGLAVDLSNMASPTIANKDFIFAPSGSFGTGGPNPQIKSADQPSSTSLIITTGDASDANPGPMVVTAGRTTSGAASHTNPRASVNLVSSAVAFYDEADDNMGGFVGQSDWQNSFANPQAIFSFNSHITMQAGNDGASNQARDINIAPGNAAVGGNAGGNLNLSSGSSAGGSPGQITIIPGTGSGGVMGFVEVIAKAIYTAGTPADIGTANFFWNRLFVNTVADVGSQTVMTPNNRTLHGDNGGVVENFANHSGAPIIFNIPIQLAGSSSGGITISAGTAPTPYSIVLPPAQGGAGTVLQNDGAGNLSWAAGGGGGSGALTVSGSEGSPMVIGTSGFTPTSDQRQLWFVVSSGGAVTVTASPQIAAGTIVGQELILMGTSDTDYPIFNDGNGLSLNGTCNLKSQESLPLIWTGSVWREYGSRTI